MSDAELDRRVREAKAEVDDYLETIQGLFAFCHETRWDVSERRVSPESRFCMARRMTTSAENRVQPNTEITPDVVIQNRPDYGIVLEGKLRFPRNADYWGDYLVQLQKYDDDLEGWYTADERIERNDIVLLTHDDHAVPVADHIEALQAEGRLVFLRPFSVIGSIRYTRHGYEQIRLRKVSGDLSDAHLDGRLHDGRSIRLETLATTYPMHLCDQPPPMAQMMSVIWNEYLPSLLPIDAYVESRGQSDRQIRVAVEDLTRLMRQSTSPEAGSPRVQGIPLQKWVSDALEQFRRLRYATRSGDEYVIRYREIKNPLDTFIGRLCRLDIEEAEKHEQQTAKASQQLSLGLSNE